MKKSSSPGGEKVVCLNRKARFEYEIFETIEGGLVLTGTEVKSLRDGQASIKETGRSSSSTYTFPRTPLAT